jgi:hypothetical protein
MTERVLDVCDIIEPDRKATRIVEKWQEWDRLRQFKKNDWEEIRRYVYATDTTQTSNSTLPWKNKTTIPKLCQIRDNLYANYGLTLFPSNMRNWLRWEADEADSESIKKREAITTYMSWVVDQPSFKEELDKLILDYIDFGNCFATVKWTDDRIDSKTSPKSGFVGPSLVRISPLDIVMNPTAESFIRSPKIVRSLTSMGELRDMLEKISTDENREEHKALFEYMKDLRYKANNMSTDWSQRDNLYSVDGFTSFREYLKSDAVEVLTFYGDMYDLHNDIFLKNYVITVVDRHRLIGEKPNPSYFAYPPIFHSPWRRKQDNLWGMGPLDNLIGMQYRLDHVENLKADVFDLTTFPVQKIKGYVEDYVWEPGAKIFVSEEGDVDLVAPNVNALQANFEIDAYERRMEEIAGAPKEAMGFRTPGEKTAYEIQRLENAAARLFQNKIKQFEEQILEPILNAMLEMARRNLSGAVSVRVFNDEFQINTFQSLTAQDITGIGRIKPTAARHFAEQADRIQNLTNLASSGLWGAVMPHFSTVRLAKMLEDSLNIGDYKLVMPFIQLAEQAEAQRMQQALQEQFVNHTMTASGINGDYDLSKANQPLPIPAQAPQGVPNT